MQSFLYDEAGRMIVDRNDPCSDGPLTNFEFVWLDDQPLAVIDADPNLPAPQLVGHITSDHLHTPRAISNASGTVTWTWAPVSGNSTSGGSNVFGDRPAQATGAPFTTRAFNLRFPGQYLDAESGLHYNYFRDYEPGTGRYIQSDPIGLGGGVSTYGYVSGSPLVYSDAWGLIRWSGNGGSIGLSVGGRAIFMYFDLTSECVNGVKYWVQVYASGPVVGAGLHAGGAGGSVEFEDYTSVPDPDVFYGVFKYIGASYVLGAGGGASYIRLGQAETVSGQREVPTSFGLEVGVDVSAEVGAGRSWVYARRKINCECAK